MAVIVRTQTNKPYRHYVYASHTQTQQTTYSTVMRGTCNKHAGSYLDGLCSTICHC